MAQRNLPQSLAPNPEPPSRHRNPFATCWTRPGALKFRFAERENAAQLVTKLAAQNWWGAVIGPHGCGKSTLLETLKPVLAGGGRRVKAVALHDGQRYLPSNFWAYLAPNPPRDLWEASPTPIESSNRLPASAAERPPTVVVIVDGYEQLGWFERFRLAQKCRRANVGLVVTAHRPTRIPTLVRLAPDRKLVVRLVAELCAEVSTPVTENDVAASLDCHGSNVRDIFFDLYDRHERGRRWAVVM